MEKGDLTYRIIGCAMTVHRELGMGFREFVYCRALAIELRDAGISFEREVWLPIHYKNYRIGHRRADFYVEEQVIVECKAKLKLAGEDFTQAINTTSRLNIRDDLLLNFGSRSLEYKHVFNTAVKPATAFTDATPALVGETGEDLFDARHYLPDWLLEKMQRDRLKGKVKSG